MIQKMKSVMVALMMAGVVALPAVVVSAPAYATRANIENSLCQGTDFEIDAAGNSGGTDCDAAGSTRGVNNLLKQIVNIISAVVGVIAVIMIIVGGFKYITSGGDSNKVSGAKNTIIYAIIGLIIVALAQIIVRFVLNQASSVV